jgi:hypothetical protein
MNKLKVLMLSKWWPFTIGHYFLRALQRRDDIDLKTTGQFSGSYIPWRNGMYVPEKYVYTPDFPLPLPMEVQEVDYDLVKMYLGDWKPDLLINTSSTCYWKNKPTDGYSVAIAIDPHVLDYDHARNVSDKFFNMQKVYSKEGDIYLPYAYDPVVHYEDLNQVKIYDVAMVGLEYPHRLKLAEELGKRGLRVYIRVGDIFDDYRKVNSQSHIVLNWSTLDDLNARAFEAPMMGIPVMNMVTDMQYFEAFSRVLLFPCVNNVQDKSHFVSTAVEQVMWAMNNLDKAKENNYLTRGALRGETYDNRIQLILDECKLGENNASISSS